MTAVLALALAFLFLAMIGLVTGIGGFAPAAVGAAAAALIAVVSVAAIVASLLRRSDDHGDRNGHHQAS